MVQTLFNNFAILFVVVDPLSLAPLFIAMTHPAGDSAYRRRMALRAVLLSAGILLVFFFAGPMLLSMMGIGIPAFRIAGGLLLFLLAIDMIFARQSGLRSTTLSERAEAVQRQDISVFPLAFPLLAGPGAITMVLLMAARSDSFLMSAGMVVIIVVVLALTLGVLLAAEAIMRWLGETGTNVVSRLFGLVLAALAVQFVIDGITVALAA